MMYSSFVLFFLVTASVAQAAKTNLEDDCRKNQRQCRDATCIQSKCDMEPDLERAANTLPRNIKRISRTRKSIHEEFTCFDGQKNNWKKMAENCNDDVCVLPPYPKHGSYVVIGDPYAFPGQTFDVVRLNISCRTGSWVVGKSILFCVAGIWSDEIPKCVPSCKLDKHPSVNYKCRLNGSQYFNGYRECNDYEPVGTELKPECKAPDYYSTEILSHMYCTKRGWNYIAVCTPVNNQITNKGDELVVDGKAAERGEFPWHASVYRKTATPYEQICGGSLVSTTVVISAAHCFWNRLRQRPLPASRFAVAVGKLHRPWDDTNDTDDQKSDVSDIKISFNFKGAANYFQDDLSVVKLATDIVYQSHVIPVWIDFDQLSEKRQLQEGNTGKVAGWGISAAGVAPDVLKAVDLPYVPTLECIEAAPAAFEEYITSDKFCAGFVNNGIAVCNSDSGGGLVFPAVEEGITRYYLRGVVSTAPNNEDACNAFTVTSFTQISTHKTFIEESLRTFEMYGNHPSIVYDDQLLNQDDKQVNLPDEQTTYQETNTEEMNINIQPVLQTDQATNPVDSKFSDQAPTMQTIQMINPVEMKVSGQAPALQTVQANAPVEKEVVDQESTVQTDQVINPAEVYITEPVPAVPTDQAIIAVPLKVSEQTPAMPVDPATICTIPSHPADGVYLISGMPTQLNIQLTTVCDPGFLPEDNSTIICSYGKWSKNLPGCLRFCGDIGHPTVFYSCLDGENDRDCVAEEPNGTVINVRCLESQEALPPMTCVNGSWDSFPTCIPECGRVTNLEQNKKNTLFPWYVHIYQKIDCPNCRYTRICGGSLVNDTVVLTAAHCFWDELEQKVLPASRYAVAVGKQQLTWDDPRDPDAQTADVNDVNIKAFFKGNATGYAYDLAVLTLATPFKFNDKVSPVCIDPYLGVEAIQLQEGKTGKVAGLGFPSLSGRFSQVLQTVDVDNVKKDQCRQKGPSEFSRYLTLDKSCGEYRNGSAICKADSGSGVVFPYSDRGADRYYLRGVVSSTPSNEENECDIFPFLTFTRVIKHQIFIDDVITRNNKAKENGPLAWEKSNN